MPLIHEPTLRADGGWTRLTYGVSDGKRLAGRDLTFAVPDEHAGMLSLRSDAAMLGLLVPAMQAGEDITVLGEVSPRLLASLNGPVQEMLLRVMPGLRRIRIEARRASAAPAGPGERYLMGFSGGGDSLHNMLRPRPAGDPAPTHLVNANVGAHGEGTKADAIFRQRLARLGEAARRLGRPLIPVDSNLRQFHDSETHFLATAIPRTAAAMLAIQSGAVGFEFSNAYHRSRQGVEVEGDVSRLEDEMLPLLSTETLSMRATGSDRTRIEKMQLVTGHAVSEDILDVCQEPRRARGWVNCGRCLKCQRALIFLEISGRLGRFGRVFDLRLHRRLRWWTHAFFLHSSPDMRREIEAYASENGYRFSRLGRWFAKPGLFQLGKIAQKLIARLP